jgi:DNA-binding CsgD family transcriptional regulator
VNALLVTAALFLGASPVEDGSLLFLENSNQFVELYTRSEITHVARGTSLSETDVAIARTIMPRLAARALIAIGSDPRGAEHWLTPKEYLILKQLILGKSVKRIADDIGRSPHTVHDHVKSLHRKLGASSRGELVARALGYLGPTRGIVEAKPTPKMREVDVRAEPAAI